MAITANDYQILHAEPCSCAHDGYLPDAAGAMDQCEVCDYEFGLNVPIAREDGVLTAHLSCVLEVANG